MELKYQAALYAGIAIAIVTVIFAFLYKHKIKKSGKAVKLANTELFVEEKYFRREMILYSVLRLALIATLVGMILATAVLIARPYYVKKIKETKYNRDIILCLDISKSVDELNMKLCRDLQETVKSLSGERVGIVIFNTSSIILSPLTDDYEYTLEQLENIRTAIKSQSKTININDSDWMYWNQFLYSGTLVGNEERGSSLIADGLLGGLFAFPETDEERTKIIIFATDNDPNGESYVSLQEAADFCTRHDVIVYGIGTKMMYSDRREEMAKAVKSTGGKFFIEEDSSSFHKIVEEIESTSAQKIEGKTIIKYIESPEKYFYILIGSFVAFILLSILLRRYKVWWCACQVLMAVFLVLTYLFAVRPAHLYSMGPDMQVKKQSNLNVLFVVDNTISMVAGDVPGGKTRLDKAKEDVDYIVDELDGAKFSLIAFNNDARVLAPYSDNSEHVKNSMNSLYPIQSYYSSGSALDVPKDAMNAVLAGDNADCKTIVFFLSDGEITKSGAKVPSYEELAKYIDGGAVLGYGTKEGGTMLLKNTWDGTYEQVMDRTKYPEEPGVSKIDEDNLESIASDLSLKYVNMTNKDNIDSILSDYKDMIVESEEVVEEDNDTGTEEIAAPTYYGFWFLIPVSLLIILNAAYVVKRR